MSLREFFAACKYGNLDYIHVVMKTARPHTPDLQTAYTLAIIYKQRESVALLETYGVNKWSKFLYACALGYVNIVEQRLYELTDDDEIDRGIDYAIKFGQIGVVLAIFARGRLSPQYGLCRACKYGEAKIAAIMIEYGARNFDEAQEYALDHPRLIRLLVFYKNRYPEKHQDQPEKVLDPSVDMLTAWLLNSLKAPQ